MSKVSWITKPIQAELDKLVPSLQAQIKKIAKDALDPNVGKGKATLKQVRSQVNKQLKDPKFQSQNQKLLKTGTDVAKQRRKDVKKTTLGKSKTLRQRAERRADEKFTTGLFGSLLLGLGSYLGYTGVKQGAENKKQKARELESIKSDTQLPKQQLKVETKLKTPTTPRKIDQPKVDKVDKLKEPKVVKSKQPIKPPTGEGSLASDVKKAMEKGKKDPEAVEFRKNYKSTKTTKSKPKAVKEDKPAPKTKPKKDLKPLEQGIREYDTPFGKLVVDSTDEGMRKEFGKGGMYKAPKKVYGARNGGFTRRFRG